MTVDSHCSLKRIGLGTMMMGWRLNEKESEKVIALAHESNILFIDTSVSYARGYCHHIIAKSIRNLNLLNRFFIATKVGGISNDNDTSDRIGYSRSNIIRQCELSLTQLNIECIDLLQLHNPSDVHGYDEILDAIVLLKAQGKIKDYGICNYSIEETNKLLTYAADNNLPLPITNQFEYNLLNASRQESMFNFLENKNISSLTWGPLASGLLTDWYVNNIELKPNSRIQVGREKESKYKLLNAQSTQKVLHKISDICQKYNMSAQILSLLWLLNKKPNNQILVGPSSIDQFMQITREISNQKYDKIEFNEIDFRSN